MSSKFSSPFMAKSPFHDNHDKKVDPDAPGTPGKPGYEPPVVKKELNKKGKKIYDHVRKENDSLLKSGMTQKQINAMRLKRLKEKKKKSPLDIRKSQESKRRDAKRKAAIASGRLKVTRKTKRIGGRQRLARDGKTWVDIK